MNRIARFEKVSFAQFENDYISTFGNVDGLLDIYENIKLPKRATKGSAGHDFFAPITITLNPKESVKIPTGIRVFIEDGWVLQNYPRSSLGFKYRVQLDNTVGIIDSDYYYSSNEGHIFVKLTNDNNEQKVVTIKQGEGFVQGIFLQFGITYDDDVNDIRDGGFGSTNK